VNEPAGIGVRAGKIWRVHRIFYQENVNAVKFLLEIFELLLVYNIFLCHVVRLWNIVRSKTGSVLLSICFPQYVTKHV